MTPADTPDIVERLRGMALGWPSLLTEAADTIIALRAAQSPQARDEGGAVEEWVMVPREPTKAMVEAFGHAKVPGDYYPLEEDWAATAWSVMLAAVPSPPQAPQEVDETAPPHEPHETRPVWVRADVDANIAPMVEYLQTIPGVRTQASCQGTLGEGGPNPYRAQVMAYWPATQASRLRDEFDVTLLGDNWGYLHPRAGWAPPQAPTGLIAEVEDLLERPGLHFTTPDVAYVVRCLAAALTPRELTDEEAERGARALRDWFIANEGDDPAASPPGFTLTWFGCGEIDFRDVFRAAFRAITEEPAR